MKAIYKSLIAAVLAAPLFTACIEETEPTNGITATQLHGSSKAAEALVWAMPGNLNKIATLSTSYHFDFGWPSMLHIRDVMTEDMYVRDAGGYNWFSTWSQDDVSLGPDYLVCQYSWNYYYKQILVTNNAVGNIPAEATEDDAVMSFYRAAALTNRAMVYIDAARCYEFLPTEFAEKNVSPEGKDIIGLTMPIVTENTTEDQARNNPRATHEQMLDFIFSDLNEAVALFEKGTSRPEKTLPSLACAYGLMARAYLWDATYQEEINYDKATALKQYDNAAKYARMAIDNSGATPLTQEQWTNTTTGFNDLTPSAWMWGGQYVTEDDAVQAGGIRTYASFMTPESTFGYASPAQGAFPEINAATYNRISDRDFRKFTFTAPAGSSIASRVSFVDDDFAAEYLTDPYISVKFRPGGGNIDDYLVGSCTAYPLMRVEEMYFIEAEAVAHKAPAQGKQMLMDFMKAYRYASYNTLATSEEDVIEEIIFQKRVEFWGEGISFYDIKRLNYSVTRWYDGTNFEAGLDTFNTNGRPAWMNFCIVKQETDNNVALQGYNSPSPAGLYVANY